MTDPSFESLSLLTMPLLQILNPRTNTAFRATDAASASAKATALRRTKLVLGSKNVFRL